jgi:glycosyltransferase involved in cell wall biosynthesis
MEDIGVIAIGRNEGERLRRCLESVVGRDFLVVYVDSDSSDGSAALARSLGAEVVELDMSIPFSAARARNSGVDRLMQISPGVKYLQFVDGDCELAAGWLDRARSTLEARADVVVVCGRRRERFAEASVYNRLADLEWDTPVGEAQSCGGDAMMRTGAFRAAGGFDPTVAAGEEPELCQRLRERGGKVLRIDAEMTLHDSAMTRFSQWWRRSVRSGYGAMDVASRFGSRGLFVGQTRSTRIWTVGWLITVLAAGFLVGAFFGAIAGAIASAIVISAVPAQIFRIAIRARRRTRTLSDAFAYSTLMMVGKWANVLGQYQYHRDRSAGRNTRLIEYKRPAIAPVPASR